jgi:hypothetical protein
VAANAREAPGKPEVVDAEVGVETVFWICPPPPPPNPTA